MDKVNIQLEPKEYEMLKEILLHNRTSGVSWFSYRVKRLLMLGVKRDLIEAIRLEADLYTTVMRE